MDDSRGLGEAMQIAHQEQQTNDLQKKVKELEWRILQLEGKLALLMHFLPKS